MLIIARILITLALALLFFAYANFAPTALSSPDLADYVKNHFLREIIFGAALAGFTIYLVYQPIDMQQWLLIALFGSIVVLPFWLAALFGWTTGGMEVAWQGKIEPNSAYWLHGSQVTIFYVGLALLFFAIPNE